MDLDIAYYARHRLLPRLTELRERGEGLREAGMPVDV